MIPRPISLYIHIPFCETKCSYCNFNTYARLEWLIPSYVEALSNELCAWGELLEHPPVRTVFLGGGTPSWLPGNAIARVMEAARQAFPVEASAEITAEANPGDVTAEKVLCWHGLGINRMSIGVQSFDDALLKLLTRRHSAAEAGEAFLQARQAGIQEINLDFIYGLPGQSVEVWRGTLEQALRLRPSHLSLYALTVEEGTPLWGEVERGSVAQPDPDLAADMYLLAEEMLGAAGYRHYEISNWALPGHESRHNLAYWRNEPFLGVGPGAHSYLEGERFWNIGSPTEYVRRLTGGKGSPPLSPGAVPVVEERRRLAEEEILAETLILNLRLDEGLDPGRLVERFGPEPVAAHVETLREFAVLGLLSEESGVYRLTSRGRLLSNELFVKLLPE